MAPHFLIANRIWTRVLVCLSVCWCLCFVPPGMVPGVVLAQDSLEFEKADSGPSKKAAPAGKPKIKSVVKTPPKPLGKPAGTPSPVKQTKAAQKTKPPAVSTFSLGDPDAPPENTTENTAEAEAEVPSETETSDSDGEQGAGEGLRIRLDEDAESMPESEPSTEDSAPTATSDLPPISIDRGQDIPVTVPTGPIISSTSIAELVVDARGFTSTVMGLAFSPDGKLLAASGDKVVRVWKVSSGELIATLRGERNRGFYGNCYGVAFSPNGDELIVGIDDYSADGSLRVYDTRNFNQLQEVVAGQGTAIRRVAFSQDGDYLATLGDNGGVFLWQWRGRRHKGTIEPPKKLSGLPLFLDFPAESPVLLLGRTGGSEVFAAPEGQPLEWKAAPPELRRWQSRLASLKFPGGGAPNLGAFRLQNGAWLAAGITSEGDDRNYWVAAFENGAATPQAVYDQHKHVVSAVAIDTRAKLCASADYFGEVHIWDRESGQTLQRLKGIGQPIYGVAWNADGTELAFSTKSLDVPLEQLNGRGELNRVLSLTSRAITRQVPDDVQAEVVSDDRGELTTRLEATDGRYRVQDQRQQGKKYEYKYRPGAVPTCATLVDGKALNTNRPIIVGDDSNGLVAINAVVNEVRRDFTGHGAAITGVSISPDGRYLASSSMDGTIRIWSLEDYEAMGEFDFRYVSDRVTEVPASSSAAKAGVKVGDQIISLDGYSLTELETMLLTQTFPYRKGDQITLKMERDGKPRDVPLTLREGAEIVEPMLTFFFTTELEWVAWTRQGYFDASPGADRKIGWHVNRGPHRASRFIPVNQLRDALYRPDLLDQVLPKGKALFDAPDVQLRDDPETPADRREILVFDVRRPETLTALEPPQVLLTEPAAGAKVAQARLSVAASVTSPTGRPIREVTLLVNGRPFKRISPPKAVTELAIEEVVELLPGANKVAIIARNSYATSEPYEIDVTFSTATPPKKNLPNLVVLAVGVSQYADTSLNLDFAASDADHFLEAAVQQQGTLYENVVTKQLTNTEATRENIIAGLQWLKETAKQRDIVVFYVSAHGFRNSEESGDYEYYLGTHDIDQANLQQTGLPATEIVNQLLTPARVVLFLDTCHSQGFSQSSEGMRRKAVSDMMQESRGFVVFASSLADQLSLEDDRWKAGAFTKALLDTLNLPRTERLTKDGLLTLADLSALIADAVRTLTSQRQSVDVFKPDTINDFTMFSLLSKK